MDSRIGRRVNFTENWVVKGFFYFSSLVGWTVFSFFLWHFRIHKPDIAGWRNLFGWL